jgi:hypothetical protein
MHHVQPIDSGASAIYQSPSAGSRVRANSGQNKRCCARQEIFFNAFSICDFVINGTLLNTIEINHSGRKSYLIEERFSLWQFH